MNGIKLKFFLRGLGVGIVLTALIFSIGYRISKPNQNVVEQAKELGMVFPEGTAAPALATEPSPEVTDSAHKQAEDEPQKSSRPKESAEPKQTADISDKKSKNTAKPAATPKNSEDVKGTRFTVRGGLLSSSVAREMMEAGIIESDKALDSYLEESGYAREIIAGTYFIPEGADYEEIAKIITGRE